MTSFKWFFFIPPITSTVEGRVFSHMRFHLSTQPLTNSFVSLCKKKITSNIYFLNKKKIPIFHLQTLICTLNQQLLHPSWFSKIKPKLNPLMNQLFEHLDFRDCIGFYNLSNQQFFNSSPIPCTENYITLRTTLIISGVIMDKNFLPWLL